MSREIDVSLTAGQYGVGGTYVTKFRQPLVLQPCEHFIDKVKKILKDEIWYITVHGKTDGTSEATKHCKKLKQS